MKHVLVAGAVIVCVLSGGVGFAQVTFEGFCALGFENKGVCPEHLCREECVDLDKEQDCVKVCLPKSCLEIELEKCPQDYCSVMTTCSDTKVCHYKMEGETAECGDLAYAGQDVPCCPGLVKKCGVEFLDGTCDMEGKNSVYNLPICLPCGDGVCGQFENRCNCPEDCGTPPDIPLIEGIVTWPGPRPAVKKGTEVPQESQDAE